MSEMIEYLIVEMNLSQSILFLVLTLPIVATIVAFARHIIGWQTLGIYAPIALTYAFYQLGIIGNSQRTQPLQGIKYGLFLTILVFVSSTLVHMITRKIRLHYVPKMSLVLIGVVISVLVAMILGAYFDKIGFINVDVLALLLIILVGEQYINIYVNKKGRTAIILSGYTILLSLLSYLLISWPVFQDFLLNYSLYILVFIIILNLIIGRWTALRVSEIFRFWDILVKEKEDKE